MSEKNESLSKYYKEQGLVRDILDEPVEAAGFTTSNLSPTWTEPLLVVVEVVRDAQGQLWETLHPEHVKKRGGKYWKINDENRVTATKRESAAHANRYTSSMWNPFI